MRRIKYMIYHNMPRLKRIYFNYDSSISMIKFKKIFYSYELIVLNQRKIYFVIKKILSKRTCNRFIT